METIMWRIVFAYLCCSSVFHHVSYDGYSTVKGIQEKCGLISMLE